MIFITKWHKKLKKPNIYPITIFQKSICRPRSAKYNGKGFHTIHITVNSHILSISSSLVNKSDLVTYFCPAGELRRCALSIIDTALPLGEKQDHVTMAFDEKRPPCLWRLPLTLKTKSGNEKQSLDGMCSE